VQQSHSQSPCLSGCPSSLFCSYRTEGERAQRELCFYTLHENAAEWRTAICIVFSEREKLYAEIQPFLNVMDSAVEDRKIEDRKTGHRVNQLGSTNQEKASFSCFLVLTGLFTCF